MIDGDQVVQGLRVALGSGVGAPLLELVREPTDVLANASETFLVVLGAIVCDRAHPGVCACAAEGLGVHHLAGGALDQVRAAQPHDGRAVHHGEAAQLAAAGSARPDDGCDVGILVIAPHDRVVVEDPGRTILTREHPTLIRQIHRSRINEVDDGDSLAHRDLLRAQDFLDRFWPPGAGLYGRIVGDDDDGTAGDAAESGDDAGRGGLSVVLVVGDEQADFQPRRVAIEQRGDALARRQFPLVMLSLDALRAPALFEAGAQLLVFVGEALQATHAATCSAAHSWMYLIRSDVGVPGPNSFPVPWDSSADMSSGGMIPPPVSSTS